MPKWLQKSFVVLITILTFGLISPSHILLNDVSAEKAEKRDALESESSKLLLENQIDKTDIVKQLVTEAEQQSYIKFGSRIKPVIEDEFRDIILPEIEKVIEVVASDYPEEDLSRLTITEIPSGGNSEKIFNIYDQVKKQDIIRFHVRKDHPPQEGYWFNFHYHTFEDQFQGHHHLGSIYWDKNTPPQWMS